MKRLLLAPLLLILLPSVFADERQREIEYEAINLVIQKYGKGLEVLQRFPLLKAPACVTQFFCILSKLMS